VRSRVEYRLPNPVFFGKVACQIAGIVDYAPDLDHAFVAKAIENKMPRYLHCLAIGPAPAERKMIRAGSFDHDLRAFHRSWPRRIVRNIAECLLDERLVSRRRGFPKLSGSNSK
jgi:hypothetical protein